MIEGACHCGNVGFTLSEEPAWLTNCNCSICRRIGGLWGHVAIDSVTLSAAEGSTNAYVQGDKTLAMVSCKNCGCTTHWESLNPVDHPHMAVNFRMCSNDDIAGFRVRHFDGADSWKFAD